MARVLWQVTMSLDGFIAGPGDRMDFMLGFGEKNETRVVCKLGGISNITILAANGDVRGFDCGPANALIDHAVAEP